MQGSHLLGVAALCLLVGLQGVLSWYFHGVGILQSACLLHLLLSDDNPLVVVIEARDVHNLRLELLLGVSVLALASLLLARGLALDGVWLSGTTCHVLFFLGIGH